MKYLLTLVIVLMFSIINAYSDCSYCLVPDGWDCLAWGGAEIGTEWGCYMGYEHVEQNDETKIVECWDDGNKRCTVSSSNSFSSLHNALLDYATIEINISNVLSGSFNINMFIDGVPRYSSVSWTTNSTTNESIINTLVN